MAKKSSKKKPISDLKQAAGKTKSAIKAGAENVKAGAERASKEAGAELEARIGQAKGKLVAKGRAASDQLEQKGYSYGVTLATEMLAAVIIGFGLGYVLDNWLGTTPWFMIGLGLLGVAAGVINVWRTVSNNSNSANNKKK